jgi:hypothetical protein
LLMTLGKETILWREVLGEILDFPSMDHHSKGVLHISHQPGHIQHMEEGLTEFESPHP